MHRSIIAACVLAPLLSPNRATAQDSTASAQRPAAERTRPLPPIRDTIRAHELYVSNDPADLRGCGRACDQQIAEKRAADSTYAARSAGVMEFHKVSYKSRVDGLEIPAYVFAPLKKRGAHGLPALVWVHGFVHGDWGTDMFPFVRDAVQHGYVVITPDYRGSTGYGDAYYKLIDYGGKEVDDVRSAVDYLATLSYVDTTRMGIMGWSHGGFITSLVLFGDDNPFKAGAAIVPVTNLIFRLSQHGPAYAREYSTQPGIQGLPFEKMDEYVKRSPVFHVANLKVPMLVHVATNDCDVYFLEDQQMVYTLQALKPELAETKIYKDPPPGDEGCGHTFSRRVNLKTLEREDTPEQIDSWNRTWAFFARNLHPNP